MPGLGRQRLRFVVWPLLIVLMVGEADPAQVSAHEGPPFPLFLDKPSGKYLVSVWADPDIGEATFYLIAETPEGGQPSEAPGVSLWVEPVNHRLDRVSYEMTQQSLRNQMQFEAQPYFDQRDIWNVGFRLTDADGKTTEHLVEVESTPPGTGPWDFAIYLFPFLLIGGLWFAAMRRRRLIRELREQPSSSSERSLGNPTPMETEAITRITNR